jgi:hypothetical protein
MDTRKQNPYVPVYPTMSGFNFVSIANLILMGLGAYFLFTKGKFWLARLLASGSNMPKHE